MNEGRWITTIIGVVGGLCFALLAGHAVMVLGESPHYFRASSTVFLLLCVWLAYRSFRAAAASGTNEEIFLRALQSGIAGAFIGLLIVVAGFAMFGQTTRTYFSHPLGWHTSELSMFQLSIALVSLGFCAGFVLSVPVGREKPRARPR